VSATAPAKLQQLRHTCHDILATGRARYGLMLGIVSHIHDGRYDVIAASSLSGIPSDGDEFELKGVYCREVFSTGRTVAITEIDGAPGMRLHPLYDIIPCEAYLSSPILVDGKVWGTLNFSGLEKRPAFSAQDILFNEAQAARIAASVAQSPLG
jgi:GAF domain-containing protein